MRFTPPAREIDRVFLHCSASDRPEHDDVTVMRKWHLERGFNDVGYHYFIRKSGEIQVGRDINQTPAAQEGHNTGTIAICLHGLAAPNFSEAQFQSVIRLCKDINAAVEGGVTFHGHCEVSSKACPVFPYRQVLGLNGRGEMLRAPTNMPAAAPSAAVEHPTLRLTDSGPAVRTLQQLLNRAGADLVIDGLFGQTTLVAVRRFQANKGLTVDGEVGPKTWEAL